MSTTEQETTDADADAGAPRGGALRSASTVATALRSRTTTRVLAVAVVLQLVCASAVLAFGPEPPRVVVDESANRIAVVVADHLVAGRFAEAAALVDPTVADEAELTPEALSRLWSRGVGALGGFQGRSTVRQQPAVGAVRVFVTLSFERGDRDLKVVVAGGRVSAIGIGPRGRDGATSAPPYVRPGSYLEQDVTVGAAPFALPATLTRPRVEERVPAVVLVHTGGLHDRNETTGAVTMFRDLAWGLASEGVAVLRYDKRGLVHKRAGRGETPRAETVDDAAAAVALLRAHPAVDPTRIVVVGHGFGGYLAGRIVQASGGVAGVVLLGAPARPPERVALDGARRAAGRSPTEDERTVLAQIEAQVAKVTDPALSPSTPGHELPLGVGPAWWLDLRGYDPVAALRAAGTPVLALFAGGDPGTTTDDRDRWGTLTDDDPSRLETYDDLDEAFSRDGASARAGKAPVYLDRDVVDDLADWVLALPARRLAP